MIRKESFIAFWTVARLFLQMNTSHVNFQSVSSKTFHLADGAEVLVVPNSMHFIQMFTSLVSFGESFFTLGTWQNLLIIVLGFYVLGQTASPRVRFITPWTGEPINLVQVHMIAVSRLLRKNLSTDVTEIFWKVEIIMLYNFYSTVEIFMAHRAFSVKTPQTGNFIRIRRIDWRLINPFFTFVFCIYSSVFWSIVCILVIIIVVRRDSIKPIICLIYFTFNYFAYDRNNTI